MNRREFLATGIAGAAFTMTGYGAESASRKITKSKFAGLKELPSVMPKAYVKNGKLSGKCACKYVDDVIWFLRDIAKARPKSVFDNPYLGAFREIHRETGLKVQFNLFYRTDFFYDMNEFTLADMPADYKSEFQDNADWIKFGFHSLQEFPDYPWLNSSYSDVAKCLKMIRGEVGRFAGDNMFARYLLPHWVPMSKDGVRAVYDAGIRIMAATAGNRFAYDGNPETLPYGHSFRVEQNRKPETALYTRESNNLAISASACGYNHITTALKDRTLAESCYVFDPDTGMGFHRPCTSPMSCLNMQELKDIPADFATVNGRPFIGYGNHEQYYYKDYYMYQPDYMERERLTARLCRDNGYRFVFMEELAV